MGAIFISYRREDTEGHAGRLFEDLAERFGKEAVFIDVSGIEPGRDFRKAIDTNVARCTVLLAMIGPRWLEAQADGHRRIDDPGDFVRIETASALKRDIPVVPVLVQGARMPEAAALPPDLADLAFRNAVELSHARWDSDVQVLAQALAPHVGSAPAAAPAPPAAAVETAQARSKGAWRVAGGVILLLAVAALAWQLLKPHAGSVDAGGDRTRIAALVQQLNDADMAQRKAATTELIAEYGNSRVAVELVVDQLSEATFGKLSKEGRVNVLTVLVESNLSAWTPAQREEAKAAVARIQQRLAAGTAVLGPQVVELLGRLEARLGR